LKIAVISDIHQSAYWRKIIDLKDEYEKIIFLGDEFDYWRNRWPFQMNNALNIITFKKSIPEKIDLCWSNHAISYYLDERCSGFQYVHAAEIRDFYYKYRDLYNVVYIYDNWIFSHGGVSKKWMHRCGITNLDEINLLFRERPDFFRWVGPDSYGNNANEGPLWIRPGALINNCVNDYNQITGHTESTEPQIAKKNNLIFVFCDTEEHNYLTVLDTQTNSVEFVYLED
jgi:hypothetical protein